MNGSPIGSLAVPRARVAKGVAESENGTNTQLVEVDPFRRELLPVVSCDGASVTATVIDRVSPASDTRTKPGDSPVVLVLPAMGTRASFYQPFADALATAGCTAVTADLRGQGESDRRAARGDRFGYPDIVERDLPAIEAALRARYPTRQLIVCAHSLGGQLATLAVGRGLMSPDALVLIAAGTAHWRHWPPEQRTKAFLATRSIGLAARALAWYPGRRLGFGGDQPRSLMADWRYNASTGGYRSMEGRRSLEPTGKSRSVPVLSLEILGDLIAPPGAAAALCSRFAAETVRRRKLAPTAGTDRWQRHFAWVRQPVAITETMLGWWRSEVRSPRHKDARRRPDGRARRQRTPSRVVKAMLLGVTLGIMLSAPTAAQSAISVHGMVESKSGGFKFPDGSVQTTAADAADPCPTLGPADEASIWTPRWAATRSSASG